MWAPPVTSAPHVATGSIRRCCAVHPGDSACPLMFQVHNLNIANACGTPSQMHVRVTSMARCCRSCWRQRLSLDFSEWLSHCYRYGKRCRTVDSSVCSWCVSRQWTGRCAGVPITNSCFVFTVRPVTRVSRIDLKLSRSTSWAVAQIS